ncbi:MAG: hypothetical protein K6T83_15385 [Alicyclobacillus sp.]|nr:hypothetical protein [Alicyclobacillus sp.]
MPSTVRPNRTVSHVELRVRQYAREMEMSFDAALAFLARRPLVIAASLVGLGGPRGDGNWSVQLDGCASARM